MRRLKVGRLMNRWWFAPLALIGFLLFPLAASADTTVHYGPFASTSIPDSGTCGNDWATDAFNRDFTVVLNPDSTFRVVEQFKGGTFVTIAGPSPGGCDTNLGGTVQAEINGSFQGYFLIAVSGGQFDPTATCSPVSCGTTADFISTVFGTGASYNVTTFLFNYNSPDQSLALHHWTNASVDRGGNGGDISN